MSKENNLLLMKKLAEYHTSHEVEKWLDLFTDDCIFDDVAIGVVARTRAERKELLEATLAFAPDWAMTPVSFVADDERGAMEWVMSGTHLGDFPGLPVSGKSFSVRGAAAARFADGRISQWTDYFSFSILKEQLTVDG